MVHQVTVITQCLSWFRQEPTLQIISQVWLSPVFEKCQFLSCFLQVNRLFGGEFLQPFIQGGLRDAD